MTDAVDAPLALVTGGQQGIGLAIARTLASNGHQVALCDLSEPVSGPALAEAWNCTCRVETFICDVGNEDQVDDLYLAIQERFDRPPDILVNNAAVQFWGPLIDLELTDWESTLKVNLTGTFLMSQRFARQRRKAGGRGIVINLGSGCNALAFPQLGSYTTSKGGIEMFTKAAALEFGQLGIRVNCLAPGAIETERTRTETEGYAERWAPLTPLGRVGSTQDVADAVLAMTREEWRFVSGQTINVDGGLFSRAVWPVDY